MIIRLINKGIVSIIVPLLKWFSSIHESRLVFQGRPDYSDNPRALSDYLVANQLYNKGHIYWLVSNAKKYRKKYPNANVTFISLYSIWGIRNIRAYYIHLTSKYVFASHNFLIDYSTISKEQQYILLWHGCGYKDNTTQGGKRFFSKALVSGPIFLKTKAKFWNTEEQYLIAKGYPRYDWLLHPSKKAQDVYTHLNVLGKKVILWMPTFRNSKTGISYGEDAIKNFPILKSHAEWEQLDKLCSMNNIILFIKLHMSQKSYNLDFKSFSSIKMIEENDFESIGIQKYEFLGIIDALISDYSSVAIDFLITNKPIAFTLDDYDDYKRLRGFVFENPLDYMPGHHLYTLQDLSQFIIDIKEGNDPYAKKREQVSKEAIFRTDCYCKELINSILKIS